MYLRNNSTAKNIRNNYYVRIYNTSNTHDRVVRAAAVAILTLLSCLVQTTSQYKFRTCSVRV